MTGTRAIVGAIVWSAALSAAVSRAADAQVFFVSTDGDDRWSGVIPAPNPARTDGPFASLARARDAIRHSKTQQGRLAEPVRVQIRGGTYYLSEPLTLAAEDSGTSACPISYEAYPGEHPVLCGGRRFTLWQPPRFGEMRLREEIRVAVLPEVQSGRWYFRSLFASGQRQIRARHPNVDPADPYRKGFLYADRDAQGFGLAVGNIHNPGDWMEYEIRIPREGDYTFWVCYGSANALWGRQTMDGQTVLIVDGAAPMPLADLPDTGDWNAFRWARAASVRLTAGEHRLKWQNVKGGGINLEAYALSDDVQWKPVSTSLPKPAADRHVLLIQAENFVRFQGKQLSVSGSMAGSRTEFHFAAGTFKPAWAAAPAAEIHIFQSASCRAFKEIVSVAKVDEQPRIVTVAGKECLVPLQPGDRYFVENVLEELDSPGEWYLDRSTGRLFHWPQHESSAEADVVAPVVGRLVQVLGDAAAKKPVSHLRFSGLAFQETDYSPDDGCEGYGMGNDGVVYLKEATDCAIENCQFRNIGKYAVCISGGGAHAIQGNDVGHSAEGGVLLLKTAGNNVSDNHIHHCGLVYKHVGGVILEGAGTDDNAVCHNLIHDVSRYGISLKSVGSRNRIEYNRVLNTSLETCDTGGIEVTQQEKLFRSGSVISHNVVGDSIGYSSDGPKPVFMSWGIYLDSFAGGYTVSHNVTYRSSHGGIMLQGGKDNTVVNNIFVDSAYSQMYISNFADNSTGLVLQRNIVYYTDPAAVLLSCGRLDENVIRIDRNLYFAVARPEPVIRGSASFADWQKRGFDRNSVIADPRFVDALHDDYTLRPDSPALKLGCEPIDTSKVGLLRGRCRCVIRPAAVEFGLTAAK